jgi:DNA-binding transcriptional LysR family regulator
MDLNLLVVLDALLAEHSVSRAARRIHSTQPTVSRALGRLRSWFGDPLLTRTQRGMVPTPLGRALAGEVRALLERAEALVERRDTFDPASSQRTFHLTMTEYEQHVLCAPLLAGLRAVAPHVTVNMLPWSLGFPDALQAGTLDMAVCPPIARAPGLRSVELFADEQVVVVRRGHPAVRTKLTLRQFAGLTHVQSAPNGRPGSLIDDLLEAEGLSRRVIMRVSSTFVLPDLVSSSDCCAILPARFAAALCDRGGLKMVPLPLDAPAIVLHLVWHERAEHDAGSKWLRELLGTIVRGWPRPKRSRSAVLDLARRAPRTL